MNDPGLDEPISNDAKDVENQERDEREEKEEDEQAFLAPRLVLLDMKWRIASCPWAWQRSSSWIRSLISTSIDLVPGAGEIACKEISG